MRRFFTLLAISLLSILVGCNDQYTGDLSKPQHTFFALDKESLTIAPDGGSADVIIYCNYNWEIYGTSDWCTPSVKEGVANRDGFVVSFTADVAYESREATFWFHCGDKQEKFIVTQDSKQAILHDDNNTFSIPSEGGFAVIKYQTNVECEVVIPEEAQSWISTTPSTRALSEHSVTLNVTENLMTSERSAVVKVVATNNPELSAEYTIRQVAAPETEPTPNKDSVVVLATTSVKVNHNGGEHVIDYEIHNPHIDTELVVTPAESWVNNIDLGTDGRISFYVEPNEDANDRSCIVTVEYSFAETVAFTVKQDAIVNAGFTIEIVDVGLFDYTVSVYPEDKKAPYIVMSIHPETILEKGFTSLEDLYRDDMDYFDFLGSFHGMTGVEVMQARVKSGDQYDVHIGNATPGVPYLFYCYYVDYASGALLSDIASMTITTATPELSDVEFNFDYELHKGCMLCADVTPVDYTGDYFFDVLPKVLVDKYVYRFTDMYGNRLMEDEGDYFQYWWSASVVEMMQDKSVDQILSEHTCIGWNDNEQTDPRSHYDFELLANTDYYLFAYTMDGNALCSSEPKFVQFKTGEPVMSQNVIEVAVDKITARTANFKFTPSNDDYYVAGWEKAADWNTFGKNDAERMEYLLHNRDYELLKGAKSINILNLESDTEYVLYAFGSRGGIATTQLYSTRFKTKSSDAGNVDISFKDLGYYDAGDFAKIEGYEYLANNSGCAIVPLEVVFSNENHGLWVRVIFDWTNRKHEVYTDKQLMDYYVWRINEYGGMGATHTYSILEFGHSYELSAVVLDTEGQFSVIYRQWIEPTYDGCGNAADYVAWWDAYMATQPASQQSIVVKEASRMDLFPTEQRETITTIKQRI